MNAQWDIEIIKLLDTRGTGGLSKDSVAETRVWLGRLTDHQVLCRRLRRIELRFQLNIGLAVEIIADHRHGKIIGERARKAIRIIGRAALAAQREELIETGAEDPAMVFFFLVLLLWRRGWFFMRTILADAFFMCAVFVR